MSNGYFYFDKPVNEPVRQYASYEERAGIVGALAEFNSKQVDVPMRIGGHDIRTDNLVEIRPPHDHGRIIGHFHMGDRGHVHAAIDASRRAKPTWASMSWEHRAAIFLRAAELLAGKYRYRINAATMIAQGKNVYQAEIDSACELIDFLRFNVHFLSEIYGQQPISPQGVNNRLEYRPLDGFVLAITPFNFTAIAGNLPIAPAMCGNVVVWKPSDQQILSARVIMDVLIEAGLPDGVINLVYAPGPDVSDVALRHPDFAGLHFTGSTATFQHLWYTIGLNIDLYRNYPRIVGETGGKDFVFVHPSADVDAVVANLIRGAFEYQGQKCSAASRAYLPSSLADKIIHKMRKELANVKMGSPEDDFGNFVGAVIDRRAFDKITRYVNTARLSANARVVIGGGSDDSIGYFVEPTVILALDPYFVTMREEIFGPVLTYYVYPDNKLEETLSRVDDASDYALTGAIFATDREAIEDMTKKLTNSAGNFYINDKPTGAVVGQQPFGGGRKSGTNDKAGSPMNLYRWLSPRSIKEPFAPATDYRYPFLKG